MAVNEVAAWLVAYDIADPRRLVRVHRYVRRRGVPIQYSVFLVEKSPAGIRRMVEELGGLVDATRDDVRVYRLPRRPGIESLGRGALPLGADLLDSAIACWIRGDKP